MKNICKHNFVTYKPDLARTLENDFFKDATVDFLSTFVLKFKQKSLICRSKSLSNQI